MGRTALWAGMAAAAGLALPQAGLAAEAGPVAKFTAMATAQMFICGSKFQIVMMGANQALQEAVDCTKQAKTEMAPYYAPVKAKFLKNPQALSLANDFYALWQASMDDLLPRTAENQTRYNVRLEAMNAELRQKGQRLNLED